MRLRNASFQAIAKSRKMSGLLPDEVSQKARRIAAADGGDAKQHVGVVGCLGGDAKRHVGVVGYLGGDAKQRVGIVGYWGGNAKQRPVTLASNRRQAWL